MLNGQVKKTLLFGAVLLFGKVAHNCLFILIGRNKSGSGGIAWGIQE
jgi:hypothetical protein